MAAAAIMASMYNHRIVVTNTGRGHPCSCQWHARCGTDAAAVPALEQLPNLGRSVTGHQSGQAAPQI